MQDVKQKKNIPVKQNQSSGKAAISVATGIIVIITQCSVSSFYYRSGIIHSRFLLTPKLIFQTLENFNIIMMLHSEHKEQ